VCTAGTRPYGKERSASAQALAGAAADLRKPLRLIRMHRIPVVGK
jgi:hypothetical protein